MGESNMILTKTKLNNNIVNYFIQYKIRKYRNIERFLSPKEAILLYKIAASLAKNSTIVEIGSWKGKRTYCLAKGVKCGRVIAIGPFDASGDGFLDTGRAGKGSITKVSMTTLDNWWLNANKPKVNVLKSDAEGAELWILQGGIEFISHCKPVIFLEIYPPNLKPYPYSAHDILFWLNANNYNLETLSGQIIDPHNFPDYLETEITFMARYNHDN